ncbi:unnamed protein product, partial [Leptidea sinapis]
RLNGCRVRSSACAAGVLAAAPRGVLSRAGRCRDVCVCTLTTTRTRQPGIACRGPSRRNRANGRRVKLRNTHPMFTNGPASLADRTERPERPERQERTERPDRPERPDRAERPDRPERQEQRPAVVPPVVRPQPQQQPQPHSNQQQRPPSNPDLSRRPIKERLIQLLALKPYKKPELYARLNSEGLKDKERIMVNKILPEIGTLKDNCYHLRRHVWNDVNEDWSFYSEEEKRKKDNGYTLNFTTVKDICPSPVKANGFSRSSPPVVEQASITVKDITNTEPLENTALTSVPEENTTELRVRNDASYQRERRRVNYLHRKLNHIKRMVLQYDRLMRRRSMLC